MVLVKGLRVFLVVIGYLIADSSCRKESSDIDISKYIQCPTYAKDIPESDPGKAPTLLFEGSLSQTSRNFFKEYRAALALVPCDATAVRVFVEGDLETEFTIAVVFIYENSVRDLEDWLDKKYHAYGYVNPIRDAAGQKCDELHHHSEPYLKDLSGDVLLNILCRSNCTLPEEKPNYEYHSLKKRSHAHHVPAAPYHPPLHPAPYHVPLHPAPYHPAPPPYHHPTPYHKEVKFDDAPEIVYGTAYRTRSFKKCDKEYKPECDQLAADGKIVECQIPRFSDCDSEWLDCIAENEEYMRKLRGEDRLYEECKIEENNPDLRAVSPDNICFDKRKCVNGQQILPEENQELSEEFVGFAEDCTDTCPVKDISNLVARYKRQTNEKFSTSSSNCRVLRARNGKMRRACDRLRRTRRKGSYQKIRKFVPKVAADLDAVAENTPFDSI